MLATKYSGKMQIQLTPPEESFDCPLNDLTAVRDALDALSGTWKLPIIIALIDGTKRFKEISRAVEGISDRMLSKELKDLEMNKLVKRTVHDSYPPRVVYSVTEHTKTLHKVITALRDWGKFHRSEVFSE